MHSVERKQSRRLPVIVANKRMVVTPSFGDFLSLAALEISGEIVAALFDHHSSSYCDNELVARIEKNC